MSLKVCCLKSLASRDSMRAMIPVGKIHACLGVILYGRVMREGAVGKRMGEKLFC